MDKIHDVFICHASEDKSAVARPLAETLRARGFNVWFDGFSLKLGDSLRAKIDEGLSSSRFGVVVLSPRFFIKQWPRAELDALAAREMRDGHKVILPVWHEIDERGIGEHSPLLAAKLGVSTGGGLDPVVGAILEVLEEGHEQGTNVPQRAKAAQQDDRLLYEPEHRLAQARFVEHLGGLIPRPAAFRHVEFRPAAYSESRFSLATLREMAVVASVDYRGWPILFYNPGNSDHSYAIDAGLETFVKTGPRWHFWQLRRSGYLFAKELLPDNRFGVADGQRFFIDVERLGPDIAESIQAMTHLFHGRLDAAMPVAMRFALLGVRGWHLGSSMPGRILRTERYVCRIEQVVAEEMRPLAEWEQQRLDLAVQMYGTCCEMFNWEAPDLGDAREKMVAALSGARRI